MRLYRNGEILTLNAEDELAEALLTRGEEIYFVGSLDDALSLADAETETVDLGGRALLSLSAYHLLPEIAKSTGDYREVPRLLRERGGAPLEWGAAAELAVLSGRVIGCPPSRLPALSPNAESVCRRVLLY